MAEQTWEKSEQAGTLLSNNKFERYKFLIGGVLMLSAVVYLIISGTAQGAQFFITIDELVTGSEYVGQSVRISGAVIRDSILIILVSISGGYFKRLRQGFPSQEIHSCSLHIPYK